MKLKTPPLTKQYIIHSFIYFLIPLKSGKPRAGRIGLIFSFQSLVKYNLNIQYTVETTNNQASGVS